MSTRVLVVGAGSIGLRHLGNLRTLGVQLGACDPDAARRARAAERHGAHVFEALGPALDAGWDAALVCTPTHTHLEVAQQAIEAGCHVFVEKPLADTAASAPALLAAAASRGRRLMVGHSMRFHPGIARLRAVVGDNALGRVLLATVRGGHWLPQWRPEQDYRQTYSSRRKEGGGVLLEYLHDFDYLRWMLGEPHQVFAAAGRVGDLEIDSDDHAAVVVRFASGALATLLIDYLRRRRRRSCELVGERAVATWDADGKAPEHSRVTFASGNETVQTLDERLIDGNEPYVAEMVHFLDCVARGTPPAVPGEEGLRSLRFVEAAVRSAATNAWVPVDTT
jgi:predicted dehydrogenase